jgi:hypothetical protein
MVTLRPWLVSNFIVIIIISNVTRTMTTDYIILIIVHRKDCYRLLGQEADDGMNTLLPLFVTRDLCYNTAGIKCDISNGKIIIKLKHLKVNGR